MATLPVTPPANNNTPYKMSGWFWGPEICRNNTQKVKGGSIFLDFYLNWGVWSHCVVLHLFFNCFFCRCNSLIRVLQLLNNSSQKSVTTIKVLLLTIYIISLNIIWYFMLHCYKHEDCMTLTQ